MRDWIKEIGKYFLDISKIVIAVAIITPLVKEGAYSIYAAIGAIVLFIIGAYILYQGAKNGDG